MKEPEPMDIYLRAFVQPLRKKKDGKKSKRSCPQGWPDSVLVLSIGHGDGLAQSLTMGYFQFHQNKFGSWKLAQEGAFYAYRPSAGLLNYAKRLSSDTGQKDSLRLYCLKDFLKEVFWNSVRAGSLIVGFSLAKDLTRMFAGHTWSSDGRGDHFYGHLKKYLGSSGKWQGSSFFPKIKIAPRDGRYPDITSGGSKDKGKYPRGRFLSLDRLAYALSGEHHSLSSACAAFGVQALTSPGSKVERVRQSVCDSYALLVKLRQEFDRHPIKLAPEWAASSATFAKKYLDAMGIEKPSEKFNLSPEVLGAAWESYHGGDSSVVIRNLEVPCAPLDYVSQFALVNVLFSLSHFLTAEKIDVVDFTEEARALFSRDLKPEDITQDLCKQLNGFALVSPGGFPFPVSADYDGENQNMGVNPLHSSEPIWFAWPDLVAAILRSGKPFDPKQIVKAFKLLPSGLQQGLRPVKFYGSVEIDPRASDIFKIAVEERVRAKSAGNTGAANSLKVVLASMAYGLFAEVNTQRLKGGDKAEVAVYAGERKFRSLTDVLERPGDWSFPPLASLICAGSRMLLALGERMCADASGAILMRDTDALAPVATRTGGLLACPGGSHRMPDGRAAVKALSWSEVGAVREKINQQLNPFDRDVVCEILKVEKVNFGPDGKQREVVGLAYSAKHYSLASGGKIAKASAHTLGNFMPPAPGWEKDADCLLWVKEAHAFLRGGPGPVWLNYMAVKEYKITRGSHLDGIAKMNKGVPYRSSIRPWNTLLAATLATGVKQESPDLVLVAPFLPDGSTWHGLPWTSKDGKPLKVSRSCEEEDCGSSVEVSTYGDELEKYHLHPEAKSLGPKGAVCGPRTIGLLSPRPVVVKGRIIAGKEIDRRLEALGAVEMVEGGSERAIYAPKQARKTRAPLVRVEAPGLDELRYRLLWHTRERVAEVSGVSRWAVSDFLSKKRHTNAATIEKLKAAAVILEKERLEGEKAVRASGPEMVEA